MKKILSVMLAIMMLFGALSVSASAADITPDQVGIQGSDVGGEYKVPATQNIIIFRFGSGKSAGQLVVYDAEKAQFVNKNAGEVTGDYVMLPYSDAALTPGSVINLPGVTAPEGKKCTGWQLVSPFLEDSGATYGNGSTVYWTIPKDCKGKIIEFRAGYENAEPEEDTMVMVLGVLSKVFGTILGLLFFDGNATQGVELINKLLGGLM